MTRKDLMSECGESTARPLLTVGIFGYNHRRFIGEALTSVLESAFGDLEVWVVDDGSSDGTKEVVAAVLAERPDPRVQVLADGRNMGLPARINDVIDRARGDWLAILGGDDAYLPEGLGTLVGAIEPAAAVIWGDLEVMREDGTPKGFCRPRDTWQGPAALGYRQVGSPVADIYQFNNFISGTSPLVRIEAVRSVGGYYVGTRNEDLDMWLRLGPSHGFKYVGASVARYRVVPGSSSRSERAAVRDQAELAGRLRRAGGYSERGLARLLAMRWALSVARSKGRPPVSLGELANTSGLSLASLRRALPRAAIDPPAGSVAAGLRRARRRMAGRNAA